jgi:hypothetical protein
MGTVHPLGGREAVGLGEAVAAYLAALDYPESAGTRRVYGSKPRALVAEHGTATGISAWTPRRSPRGSAAPGAPGRRRRGTATGTLRGLLAFAEAQGWLADAAGLTRGIRRRKRAPDNSRALFRADVEQLLTREDIAIRERVLWRLL